MSSHRGQVLGLYSEDPVLTWIGPIGLGLAAGTALIVDHSTVAPFPGRTLHDLLIDGPRLAELSPGRPGVATIGSGSVAGDSLEEAVGILARSWPAVVVRCDGTSWTGSCVPYRPIYPGVLRTSDARPAAWQPTTPEPVRPANGHVLPRINGRAVRAMLEHRRPVASRWVQGWNAVWEQPWA